MNLRTTEFQQFGVLTSGRVSTARMSRTAESLVRLPLTGGLTLAYAASLFIAALMVGVSIAAMAVGSERAYGVETDVAVGVTKATAGLLVPEFLGHDVFNLVVAVPLLLGAVWLARRGSLIGLLMWPGVLFYVVYTYAIYLIGAPFSGMFLAYVVLVALSAYTTIGVVARIDGKEVRQRLGGAAPARIAGGILVGLAVLTIGQDGGGAIATALAGNAPNDPVGRSVWIADLAVEIPAVLVGGVLLWRRRPLGYVTGAGLLLQFGLTPLALVANMALHAVLTSSAIDVATVVALLGFSAVCVAPLALMRHAAAGGRAAARGV